MAFWRQTNVTPIPKGPPSFSVANYWPISVTSVLSKVFERLVSVCHGWFMEHSGVLPTTKFAYRKGLGTCDAPLWVSHTLKSALESGQEARIMLIDFIAAFDRVNHLGILYKLCSVSIGGSVLSILTQFLSNQSQNPWSVSIKPVYSIKPVVGVNWWTLYQECRREVFWAHYCSSCTLQSFFLFWKISWSVMLMTPFDGCCAIPWR